MSRSLIPLVAIVLGLGAASCSSRGGVTPVRTAFNRGVHHYTYGRFDEAAAEFRQALEEDESDHRARFNLALALEARAESLEASGARDVAVEIRKRAEAHYREIIEKRPGDVRPRVNLAACLFAQGRGKESNRVLDDAVARFPNDARPLVALGARRLAAANASSVGETTIALTRESIELLDRSRALDSTSLEANALLGEANGLLAALLIESVATDAREHLETARARFDDALRRAPDDFATLLAAGRLEARVGEALRAKTLLERCLAIDPEHALAHRAIAGVFEAEGELESAVLHLWLARRAAPEAGDRARLVKLYRALLEREAADGAR